MRVVPQSCIDLIKSFEGLKLKAYKDIKGILTIGYGHTGPDVKEDQVITLEEALELLKKDISRTSEVVEKLVKVPVTDNQFSALVSFVYNVGTNALKNSTLLRLLNEGKDPSNEFTKWVYANKIEVPGLKRRRLAEQELFRKPIVS